MGATSSVQREGAGLHPQMDAHELGAASPSISKGFDCSKTGVAKERPRYGNVDVHVTSVSNLSRSRPVPISVSYSLNSLGGLIHGSTCDPHVVCDALESANLSETSINPNLISLSDGKAQSTLVTFTGDSWYAIPSIESNSSDVDQLTTNEACRKIVSSPLNMTNTYPLTAGNAGGEQQDRRGPLPGFRNNTTCLVLGDKTERGQPHVIKLGDRLRLGSVGLVVCAIRYNGEPEQVLDRSLLRLHLDSQSVVLTEEDEENMAILAAYEAKEGMVEEGGADMNQKRSNETMQSDDQREEDPESSGWSGDSSSAESDKDRVDSPRPRSESDTTEYGDSFRGSTAPPSPVSRQGRADTGTGVSGNPPPTKRELETEGKEEEGDEELASESKSDSHPFCKAACTDGACSTSSSANKMGLTRGERYICYMCYETHDTATDPLVAPCECRGDTRYLHVKCLQRWFHSSMPTMPDGLPALQRTDGRPLLSEGEEDGEDIGRQRRSSGSSGRAAAALEEMDQLDVSGGEEWEAQYRLAMPQVVRTASNGSLACKICGAAYKTSFRRMSDGKKKDILLTDNVAPYIVLTVVTRHDGNPDLYNTRFRINFTTGWQQVLPRHSRTGVESVIIGRSSNCDMVLDYRTVSTTHARVSYHHKPSDTLPTDVHGASSSSQSQSQRGCFVLEDMASSNGTMLHLLDPLPLRYGENIRLRMGRCNVSLLPRRNRVATARYRLAKLMSAGIVTDEALAKTERAKTPYTPQEVQMVLGRAADSSRISPPPSTGASPPRTQEGASPPPRPSYQVGASFSPRSPYSSPRRDHTGLSVTPTRPGSAASAYRVVGAGAGLGPPAHHVFTGLMRDAEAQYDRDRASSGGMSNANGSAGRREGAQYCGIYTGSSLSERMSRAVNPRASSEDHKGQEQEQEQEQEQGGGKEGYEKQAEQEGEQKEAEDVRAQIHGDDPGLLVPPLTLALDAYREESPRRLSSRDRKA